MAVDAPYIVRMFKNVGKILFIGNKGLVDSGTYRKALMATVRQAIYGLQTEFDDFNNIVAPFESQMKALVSTLEKAPSQSLSTITTYLPTIVAVDLGLASGSTLAQVGDALLTQMTALSQTVATLNSASTSNFAFYFSDQLGITLPTSGTPTILDSYVTDTIIP